MSSTDSTSPSHTGVLPVVKGLTSFGGSMEILKRRQPLCPVSVSLCIINAMLIFNITRKHTGTSSIVEIT